MGTTQLIHRAEILTPTPAATRSGARIMLPPPLPFLLLLLAACALFGAPRTARAAAETFEIRLNGPSDSWVVPVQNFGSGWEVQGWKIYDTSPFTDATLSLSWTADGTTYTTAGGIGGHAVIGGVFGYHVPGDYTVTFKADYSQLTPRPQDDVTLTATMTFVAVTNITASTNHIALGTNRVTLTAQTTAAIGDEHITWFASGGSLSSYSGKTVEFVPYMHGPSTVVAWCGSSSAATTVYVYAITGVSASPNPVAVGDTNLVLTATVSPSGCPLPIKWSWKLGPNEQVLSDSGLTVQCTPVDIGKFDIKAELGVSVAYTDLWSVGVKKLEYQNPQGDAWENVSGASYERVGQELVFRAIKDPEDAPSWPAGYPMWAAASDPEVGPYEATKVTFSEASHTLADLKTFKARCGTSTKSASTTVFSMTLTNVPAEHWAGRSYDRFGLGEVVTVKVIVTPPGLTAITAGVQFWPKVHAGAKYVLEEDQMKATFSHSFQDKETENCELTKRGQVFTSKRLTFIRPDEIFATPLDNPSTILPGEQAEYDAAVAVPPPPLLGPLVPPTPIRVSGAYRLRVSPNDVSFTKLTYHHPETPFFPQLLPPGPGVDAGSILPKWESGIQLPTPGQNAKIGIVNLVYEPKLAEFTVLPNSGASGASVLPFYRVERQDGGLQEIEGNAIISVSGSFRLNWSAQMEALGKTWTRTYGPPPP